MYIRMYIYIYIYMYICITTNIYPGVTLRPYTKRGSYLAETTIISHVWYHIIIHYMILHYYIELYVSNMYI